MNVFHAASDFKSWPRKTINMIFFYLTVLTLLTVVYSREVNHLEYAQKREKRNTMIEHNTNLTDILRRSLGADANIDLLQYTPTTPSPQDVNCYVEVPVTRRVGGKCVSFGDNAMGCQAGIYLALSSECNGNQHQTGHSPSPWGRQPPGRRNNIPYRRRGHYRRGQYHG